MFGDCICARAKDEGETMSLNNHLAILRKALEKMTEITIEDISEYADVVVRKNVNSDFIKNKMMENIKPGRSWNMTSAGNIAYVILYCDDKTVVEEAKKKLEAFREYVRSNR